MEITPHAVRIRELNDAARTKLVGCRVVITAGVKALGDLYRILGAVQAFDSFSEGNDPHGEHDFGSFKFADETLYWKFDYYDKSMEWGSEDPADPAITTRVLTIMLRREY
jgi:hypothetical protein